MFLVERYLPGMSTESMRAGAARAQSAAAGTAVRYLGSTVIPEEEACFCTFEAPSAEAVAEVNERAAFPFARIVAGVAVEAQEQGR